MTTATPDEERRAFVRQLFGSKPEPQRPDETDGQYARRVFFHDPENPETFQSKEHTQ